MSAKTAVEVERPAAAMRRGLSKRNREISFADLLVVDPSERISLVREGLPAAALQSAADFLGISQRDLLTGIRVPVSTITARIRDQKPLSPEESDKLVRLAEAVKASVAVFGDAEEGKTWLTDTVLSLGGKRPLDLLDTQDGYTLVMQTLGRIQFGAPA